MQTWKRGVAMAAALAATFALAQSEKPSAASTPLELDPNPSLTKHEADLQAAWFKLLEDRSGALVPSRKESEAALKETKRLDFRESDEALARFAEKAGTLYVVYASLQYTVKKQLVLQGRVVRDDGKLMKTARVELAKGDETIPKRFPALAEQFLKELELAALPSFKEAPRPVEPPPVVKTTPDPLPPPPPAPPVVVIDHGAGQRTVGKVLVIGGAAVAVLGGALAAVGGGVGGSLGVQNGNLPATRVADYRSAQTLTGAGFATAGVGVAAAAVGAIVWAVAPAAPVSVGAMPMRDGMVFSFQGSF